MTQLFFNVSLYGNMRKLITFETSRNDLDGIYERFMSALAPQERWEKLDITWGYRWSLENWQKFPGESDYESGFEISTEEDVKTMFIFYLQHYNQIQRHIDVSVEEKST